MQHKVSVVHVYKNSTQKSAFKLSIEYNNNVTIYFGTYKQDKFKFFASAKLVYQALKSIKKNKIDLFFLNVFYPLGAHLPWLKLIFRKPIFALEHWTGFHAHLPGFKAAHKHLKLAKMASLFCNRVFGVSKNLAETMKNVGVKNVNGLVYNTVNTAIFNANAIEKETIFTFLHISHLKDKHKNFTLLLKAFTAFSQGKNVQLWVINSGDILPYQKTIQNLGIANKIRVFESMNSNAVAVIMKKSHVFVLSSNYENMPCVISETLCCGLPIISTDVGGISEIISNENGLLVALKDTIALAKAMDKMYLSYNGYNNDAIAQNAQNLFGETAVLKQFNHLFFGNEMD